MRILQIIALSGLLAGCGIVRDVQDNERYRQSVNDYRNCLAVNPANVSVCEAKRLIMVTDENAANRGVLHRGETSTFIVKQN